MQKLTDKDLKTIASWVGVLETLVEEIQASRRLLSCAKSFVVIDPRDAESYIVVAQRKDESVWYVWNRDSNKHLYQGERWVVFTDHYTYWESCAYASYEAALRDVERYLKGAC